MFYPYVIIWRKYFSYYSSFIPVPFLLSFYWVIDTSHISSIFIIVIWDGDNAWRIIDKVVTRGITKTTTQNKERRVGKD